MGLKLLFTDKKFVPVFWTQFWGALNDNLLKNALIILVTFKGLKLWGFDSEQVVAMAGGVFILPFFLFSSFAGQWADKFEKSKIIRLVKLAEIFIMALAGVGFYLQEVNFLMASLFLMGMHSTIFGPVKYSILPEILPESQMIAGNAYVELGTFMAILIGTVSGGLLVSQTNGEFWILGSLMLIAVIGFVTACFVAPVKIAAPHLQLNWNPIGDTIKTIRETSKNATVFNSILGISWFWFFGASLLSVLPVYVKSHLGGGEQVVTLFLACFTIGIAIGSVLCEKLSFERVELGIVPIGSLMMTFFLVDLYFASETWREGLNQLAGTTTSLLTMSEYFVRAGSWRIILDLSGLSVFGGLFIVPLYTLVQTRAPAGSRSRVIAANNIINALFMVASALMMMGFYAAKLTLEQIFLVLALMNLVVSTYIYLLVPEFAMRFLVWILVHIMYRVRYQGLQHLPKEGAAVLVCNHVSYVDWLIISGVVRRPIRFVMHHELAELPLLKYFLRQAKVIPITSQKRNPEVFEKAMIRIREELAAGELICIFPEGKITLDGKLNVFRAGIEQIIATTPVQVFPLALRGLWGSFFSYKDGKAFRKLPHRLRHPVELIISEGLAPGKVTAEKLQEIVAQLAS